MDHKNATALPAPPREPDDQTRRDLRRLDTNEDRCFWSAVDAAAREVETWPAWRRGVSEDETRAEAREVE